MLPPIQTPEFKYPSAKIPDLSKVPIHSDFVVDEPYLTVTDVPWQGGRGAITRLLSVAAPEMGSKLEHKDLGGKLTVCVLCYGNYPDLHQRCLESITRTIPQERMDLRICANAVGRASLNYFSSLPCTKVYVNEENKFKYPCMRQMFHDDDCPITTPYTVWFDDTAYVQHNNWVNILANDILLQGAKVAMYGLKLSYSIHNGPGNILYWLKERPWHRGKPLRGQAGNPIKDGTGNYIHFCADWFFAIRSDAIASAAIPDLQLLQKGGDIVIGEQLYQAGLSVKNFNLGKAYVFQPNYKDQIIRNFDYRDLPWLYALA